MNKIEQSPRSHLGPRVRRNPRSTIDHIVATTEMALSKIEATSWKSKIRTSSSYDAFEGVIDRQGEAIQTALRERRLKRPKLIHTPASTELIDITGEGADWIDHDAQTQDYNNVSFTYDINTTYVKHCHDIAEKPYNAIDGCVRPSESEDTIEYTPASQRTCTCSRCMKAAAEEPIADPIDQKTDEQEPIEQKPIEQKTDEQEPIEQKPIEQKPDEQKPIEEPIQQKTDEQKPIKEPIEQKTDEQEPIDQKTDKQKSIEKKPIDEFESDHEWTNEVEEGIFEDLREGIRNWECFTDDDVNTLRASTQMVDNYFTKRGLKPPRDLVDDLLASDDDEEKKTPTKKAEDVEIGTPTKLPNTQQMRSLMIELDREDPETIQMLDRWIAEEKTIMDQMTPEEISGYHEEPPHSQLEDWQHDENDRARKRAEGIAEA